MPVSRARAAGAALAVTGLAVFGLQAPATADHQCPNPPGHYPPGQCAVGSDNAGGVSDNTPVPGQQGQVNSNGHKPNSKATVHAESTPIFLGTFTANAQGVISATVTIPAALSVGRHNIVVRGVAPSGLPLINRFPFTVTSANAAIARGNSGSNGPGSGAGTGNNAGGGGGVNLPTTGAEIAAVTGVGLALLAGGGLAFYAGRRRRQGLPAS